MQKTASGVMTLPSWMKSVKKLYNTFPCKRLLQG
ncbi:hypothetical protein QIT81_gp33 [Pseudomonas phage MR15]|uniref:Uncharacterized protein n=1 Tax=Pseudomonas phage MR15 TaxID=2711179 RepID=A0A6M3TE33_9CAUD|nr:hypothetical protein QIT81_gp33 [Pseudomonas phage MR15]QJD55247.1 hypothetical protein Psm1vBMR15_gp33c [Pseudomonas phage MR15]